MRRSGSARHAVKPPPGPLDPIVEEEIDKLAGTLAHSQTDAKAVLSDPARTDRIPSITNRLNQTSLDPLVQAMLSRPEIYEALLAQALSTEEAEAPETQLARAVDALATMHREARSEDLSRSAERQSEAHIAETLREVVEALRNVVADQQKQAEAFRSALIELRTTRQPAGAEPAKGTTLLTTRAAAPAPAKPTKKQGGPLR